MGIKTAAAMVALAATITAGCSSSDDDAETTTSTTSTSTTTAPPPIDDSPTLDKRPIDGFVPASVTFANLTYDVTAALVTNQELRSIADGTEPLPGSAFHVVVDVRVENAFARQLASEADDISLAVGDDRIPLADDFLSDAVGFIRPNETVESFFAFEVDDPGADLSGAELVFGSAPDRLARLALAGTIDTEPAVAFPRTFALSGVAEGTGPTNAGTIEFSLLEGALFVDLPHGDTTSPTGERADENELFLQLHVRAAKTSGRGSDLLIDAFRLQVDGVPRAPFDVATSPTGSTQTASVNAGAAADAWLLFVIPADAEDFVLDVGAVDEPPGSIPFEVPEESSPTSAAG